MGAKGYWALGQSDCKRKENGFDSIPGKLAE